MTEPASNQRRGLGRGLAVLIGQPAGSTELHDLPVGAIRPNRRQTASGSTPESVSELAESVRVQGVVQPILVRPAEEGYELIAGERRWRAARAAGLPTIPAVVREAEDEGRCSSRSSRTSRREPDCRRGGPCLRVAARRVRADARGRWPNEWVAPSRACRTGFGCSTCGRHPRARRARPADGGTRAGRAGGARSRGTPPPRSPDRSQRHVRAGRRAGGALGRCPCSAEGGKIPGRPGVDRPRTRGANSADGSGLTSVGPGRLELRFARQDRVGRGSPRRPSPPQAGCRSRPRARGASRPALRPVSGRRHAGTRPYNATSSGD